MINGRLTSLTTSHELTDVLPGTLRLTVRKEGYQEPETRVVEIQPAAKETVTFVLQPFSDR